MARPPIKEVAARAAQLWRFFLLIAFYVALGVIAWTLGADWFEQTFPVSTLPLFQHAERPSLAVCFMTAGAAFLFLLNAVKVLFTGASFDLGVPKELDPILAAAVPVSVGILIGTTIFT